MQLRRGEKKTPGKGAEQSEKKPQPPALISFWMTALIANGLILVLVLVAVLFAWGGRELTFNARHLESCSAMLVRDLGNRTAALQGRLREWGSDPILQAALRSGDPARMRAVAEELTGQMPGVLQVRLLGGGTGSEPGESGSLSYAGLDMVHQAARQRRVSAVEVHRVGSPDVHLAIAGPVLNPQGDQALGVVHVALPLSMLPAAQDAGSGFGHIRFQQKAGSEYVVVDPDPGRPLPDGAPDLAVDVPGTQLRVAAWVERAGIVNAGLLLYAGPAFLLALGLMGLAMFLPLRGVRQSLSSDHAGLVALVEDAVNRRPLRRLRCQLAETQPIAEVIGGLLTGLQASKQAVRGGAEGDSTLAPTRLPASVMPSTTLPVTEEAEPLSNQGTRELLEFDLSAAAPESGLRADEVPAEIFRAYDIRGVVGMDLTPELVRVLGRAVAAEAEEAGDQTVLVARDTRASGVALSAALVEGVRASGRDVVDLGVAPTPLLYFATCFQGEASGVVVTGSHNPSQYNGLKVVVGGVTLDGHRITALRERMVAGGFSRGDGHYRQEDLVATYVQRVEEDVAIARKLKVVIDCGNGAAAVLAPRLYGALGCELVELNCDPGGGFPDGRVPDPARPECLAALQQRVRAEHADLGLAFDGDGDRLGVVDSSGKIIWPDRVLMHLAGDVLSRHPGTDVIFDVKSSRHLAAEILRNGGRPVMWKAGHSPLKAKLLETGALLAGEWSGHIIFKERWYGFDDALYAGARLLEVLALDPRPTAEVFAVLPESPISVPEIIVTLAEGQPARIMTDVLKLAQLLDGVEVKTIDGLRVEFEGGFGLVRASNTQPALTFRFEADDEIALRKIQGLIRRLIERTAPELSLPF